MITQQVKEQIIAAVGMENVITEKEDLMSYSYDATPDVEFVAPELVVTPTTTKQVQALVKIAAENKIPLYTRGAGTNLSGGTLPIKKGIVVNMVKMNKIVEIDAENLVAVVEPGVVVKSLSDAIAVDGLIYPPDPGTVATATIGGTVAECAGGLRGLKYGVTKHYVMGIEAVLANGEVITAGGKTVKNVSGYDLTKLFVGSEGTLGIITKVIVKLMPAPEYRKSMMAIFHDLDKAAVTISDIISNKVIPATLEIMDNTTIKTVEDFAKIGLPTDAEAILLIEVDGTVEEVVARDAETVVNICNKNGATKVQLAKSEEEKDQLWAARRAALPALGKLKPTTVLEDATVPRSKIPHMIRAVTSIAKKYDLVIGTFGHAGDGNLHPTIICDINDKDEMTRVHKAVDEMFKAALDLDGTLSGEHGIGIAKMKYMEWEFGPAGMDALRAIKKALDPDNIMNPGKMLGGM